MAIYQPLFSYFKRHACNIFNEKQFKDFSAIVFCIKFIKAIDLIKNFSYNDSNLVISISF